MSFKKSLFIVLILFSLVLLVVLYQLKVFRTFVSPLNDDSDSVFERDSTNLMVKCIVSFFSVNGLMKYLKKDIKNYTYLSFHKNPLNYDNIGKECSAVLYDGQQNTTMKAVMNSCFYPFKISENQREKLQKALKLVKNSFEERGIELVLTGGSFIGSWRYHQMIPYDDDIDFYILSRQKPAARKLLESLSSNKTNEFVYKDSESFNQHWKLGVLCKDSKIASCFIVIDFFFMWRDNDEMHYLEWPASIKVDRYYPLRTRPFENVLFHSPNDFSSFLLTQYSESNNNVCHFKNHVVNSETCVLPKVDCDLLKFTYPYKVSAVIRDLHVEMIVYRMTVTSVFLSRQ